MNFQSEILKVPIPIGDALEDFDLVVGSFQRAGAKPESTDFDDAASSAFGHFCEGSGRLEIMGIGDGQA